MQVKLLLNGFGQIPAKKQQCFLAKTFGMQKAPRFVWCRIQNKTILFVCT